MEPENGISCNFFIFLCWGPIGVAPGTGVPIGDPRVGVHFGDPRVWGSHWAAPGSGVPIGVAPGQGLKDPLALGTPQGILALWDAPNEIRTTLPMRSPSLEGSQHQIILLNGRLRLDKGQLRKKKSFWVFTWIQGVQEAIQEGPELLPELKNDHTCNFLKLSYFLLHFIVHDWGSPLALRPIGREPRGSQGSGGPQGIPGKTPWDPWASPGIPGNPDGTPGDQIKKKSREVV